MFSNKKHNKKQQQQQYSYKQNWTTEHREMPYIESV